MLIDTTMSLLLYMITTFIVTLTSQDVVIYVKNL